MLNNLNKKIQVCKSVILMSIDKLKFINNETFS